MPAYPIYTKEVLQQAIQQNTSWVGVIRTLGRSPRGGGLHRWLKLRATHYGLDFSHFTGSGWAKGTPSNKKLAPALILVKREPSLCRQKVQVLRRALLETGREHRCAVCGLLPLWLEQPLVLQIDHINGDSSDDRQDNLRFLCPNCHAQTGNFGGNARRGRPASAPGARLLNE